VSGIKCGLIKNLHSLKLALPRISPPRGKSLARLAARRVFELAWPAT
jgi:hypothetical protein